jgi:GlpG protein
MYLIGELKDKKMLQEIQTELTQSGIEFSEKYFPESDHYALYAADESRQQQALEIFRIKLGFKKSFEIDQDWVKIKSIPRGPITLNLVIFCSLIYLLSFTNMGKHLYDLFSISRAESDFLNEVSRGQVWRLLTPIFLHMNLMHILFNMMWFKDLGYLLEHQYKKEFLIIFIVGTGVFSNILQYFVSGPNFGGMSGVLYAMLGFIWVRSKCDSSIEYKIPQRDLMIMIGWMFLCLTGLVGPVANLAHAAGLFSGMMSALLFFNAPQLMKLKMTGLAFLLFILVLAIEWGKYYYRGSQFFIFMWT